MLKRHIYRHLKYCLWHIFNVAMMFFFWNTVHYHLYIHHIITWNGTKTLSDYQGGSLKVFGNNIQNWDKLRSAVVFILEHCSFELNSMQAIFAQCPPFGWVMRAAHNWKCAVIWMLFRAFFFFRPLRWVDCALGVIRSASPGKVHHNFNLWIMPHTVVHWCLKALERTYNLFQTDGEKRNCVPSSPFVPEYIWIFMLWCLNWEQVCHGATWALVWQERNCDFTISLCFKRGQSPFHTGDSMLGVASSFIITISFGLTIADY